VVVTHDAVDVAVHLPGVADVQHLERARIALLRSDNGQGHESLTFVA
jgi:hypothetical protein